MCLAPCKCVYLNGEVCLNDRAIVPNRSEYTIVQAVPDQSSGLHYLAQKSTKDIAKFIVVYSLWNVNILWKNFNRMLLSKFDKVLSIFML